MAAAVVDTAYLASFCSVPQTNVQTLIDQPTQDLVLSFLQSLTGKAQEHDKLQSERYRLDVELENAVRGGESRAQTLKVNADKALEDVKLLGEKLNQEEKARSQIESQFQSLQSSTSNSSGESQGLRAQVARLETSNRETLSLLEAKTTAHDKLADDLKEQHQKTIGLRRELANLEERNQVADNTLSNVKFHESTLQGEVDRLKRHNEWLDTEMKTMRDESATYRKEKSARIAELQRTNDDSASTISSLKRTETTLRRRLEEVGQKADDAFSKIQQMQEDATRRDESFRAELDSARRLEQLQKQSADTARRRVSELDEQVEQTKSDAADEIGQCQAELETEREGREAAEQKVDDLEAQIERLESNQAHQQNSTPGTPRAHGLAASFGTSGGVISPGGATPGSARGRSGLNFTQLYADYNNVKSELDGERRNNERLRTTIDDMIQDLEKKEPEIQELQLEHARLQSEVAQLSSHLGAVGEEKDLIRKESRKWHGQVDGLVREGNLLRQQLRDLSVQVKVLLVEVQTRTEGVELSPTERQMLQKSARGETDEKAYEGMSDTGRFISERLTTFKNVFELQETNTKLLHLTRQLGEQMEGEEARARQDEQEKDRQELVKMRDRVERLKDELQSMATQSQSFVRERDMFRRMLSHRGQIPSNAEISIFGESVNGAATPRSASVASPAFEGPDTSKQLQEHVKLLKELQSQYDAYRREASTDHKTLKTQLDQLAKDKSDLQGDIARVSSQLTLAHERHEMLQGNYRMIKSENEEVQKRSQSLAETAAKQDIRTQQVAEELVEAKSLSESLRNENANLKAEKDLWKRIENRLNEDNSALVEERSRLNKNISDTQRLLNERELSDSELRRQQNNQITELESQLKTANRKLDEETDESKKTALRREYEAEQSRTRIDDLVKALGNTKEELASVKSTRDQLEARLEEMKIELRTAREHAQALQPRPTPKSAASSAQSGQQNDENTLSREQELGIEVADVKRELDLSKSELESAKGQVEQYKAISQASEEELQNLNEAHDEFKEDMDKVTAEKDALIKELEQRVHDISSELSLSNNQLSELRSSQEDVNSRLEQQKSLYEEEMSRAKEEASRQRETVKIQQEDVRAQADIAQQAQQSYENELVKHAEAAKQLQKTRSDYNDLKLEASQAKADAEGARATVTQNEESWSSTKDQYERELLELKRRRDDVDNQNKLLHQQLEDVSSQISSLQHKRTSTGDENDESHVPQGSDLQNLQEVIRYLRREKEIVDVQYEMSQQEAKRLKQQLDYTQSQLDETRLRLDEERRRQADQDRSSASQTKLVETINELNVFRESSVTLRNEARQAQSQLSEKSKKVEELIGQIQPLQASLREMENEKETTQGEMKLLQEDRDRWQQRTQNILQKYDRVDPAELEGLKERITGLEAERDEATAQKSTLQERADSLESAKQQALNEQKQDFERRREALVDQFKTRSRELSSKIKAAENDNRVLTEQLQSVKKELEETRRARDDAVTNGTSGNAQQSRPEDENEIADGAQDAEMNDVPEEGEHEEGHDKEQGEDDEEGEIGEEDNGDESGNQTSGGDRARINAAEAQVLEQSDKAKRLEAQVSQLESKRVELEEQVANLQSQLQQAHEEAGNLRNQVSAGIQGGNEHMNKLQEDLQNAQNELEVLKSSAGPQTSEGQPSSVSDKQGDAGLAKKQEELEASYNERVEQAQKLHQQRTNEMKGRLNKILADSKDKIRAETRAEIQKEHEEAMSKLREDHEKEIAGAKERHQRELEQARKAAGQDHSGNQDSMDTTAAKPPAQEAKAQSASYLDFSKPPVEWQITEDQARALITHNQTLKGILMRNIKVKLDQEVKRMTEESIKKFQEIEQSANQKLDEQQSKFDKVKEQAVTMESKKFTVKLNMAENKARIMTARLEIFEKAANTNPKQPVVEVWMVAKDFKPPPPGQAGPQQRQQQQQPGHIRIQTPAANAAATPRPASAQSGNAALSPQEATKKPPTRQTSQPPTTRRASQQSQIPHPTAVTPSDGQDLQQQPDRPLSRPASRRASHNLGGNRPTTPSLGDQQRPPSRPPSQNGFLPTRPPAGQAQPEQGTGPAALKGIANQSTGIPRGGARGGAARGGGGIARGGSQQAGTQEGATRLPDAPLGGAGQQQTVRGGGVPRGGFQGRSGSTSIRGAAAAAGSANLSPAAKTFQPGAAGENASGGNKRPRGDSDVGNVQKRARGGRGGLPQRGARGGGAGGGGGAASGGG